MLKSFFSFSESLVNLIGERNMQMIIFFLTLLNSVFFFGFLSNFTEELIEVIFIQEILINNLIIAKNYKRVRYRIITTFSELFLVKKIHFLLSWWRT